MAAPRSARSRPSRTRLGTTVFDRLPGLIRPRWTNTVRARRILAAALALLAVAVAVRGDPRSERVAIIVAARDLPSGRTLAPDDLRSIGHDAGTVPSGALRTPDLAVGRTLAGAARAGEPITDVRVLGARLAELAAGSSDARIVPIRLADRGVAGLLRSGDRVDVVAATEPNPLPDGDESESAPVARTLAIDAAVVLVSDAADVRDTERMVMVALPAAQATAVAAASLSSALTVVFH
ncbi:RcpC/CpaB family pilus assembly protein [Aldersonia sp. NBC_00410]|uniref:RcpC/CpaB family pilus assembly protein n=1 Tax=Aldersonia sp. NBC_00410 TaxID=2975954 RepID=UPI002258B557|nr:RcpC/CpaB family pilus assembly protein [Aldersonia sp. NBC_00410]MCX5045566.1 RcpC/CpaB family pilus assembly protein [Aldersonia sp. NBC_00410]